MVHNRRSQNKIEMTNEIKKKKNMPWYHVGKERGEEEKKQNSCKILNRVLSCHAKYKLMKIFCLYPCETINVFFSWDFCFFFLFFSPAFVKMSEELENCVAINSSKCQPFHFLFLFGEKKKFSGNNWTKADIINDMNSIFVTPIIVLRYTIP